MDPEAVDRYFATSHELDVDAFEDLWPAEAMKTWHKSGASQSGHGQLGSSGSASTAVVNGLPTSLPATRPGIPVLVPDGAAHAWWVDLHDEQVASVPVDVG